jgi:hypothetical protein
VAIRNWHPGQVVLLWIAAVLVEWPLWLWLTFIYSQSLILSTTGGTVIGLIVLLLVAGIPIPLFVVTWKWFGGRR